MSSNYKELYTGKVMYICLNPACSHAFGGGVALYTCSDEHFEEKLSLTSSKLLNPSTPKLLNSSTPQPLNPPGGQYANN